MGINTDDLPMLSYACFRLNNYCDMNNECAHDDFVRISLSNDRDSQPPMSANRYSTDKSVAEEKRVKSVLARLFDS